MSTGMKIGAVTGTRLIKEDARYVVVQWGLEGEIYSERQPGGLRGGTTLEFPGSVQLI